MVDTHLDAVLYTLVQRELFCELCLGSAVPLLLLGDVLWPQDQRREYEDDWRRRKNTKKVNICDKMKM